ncbi:mannose-6-phosphate isomerase, class I [Nocardioides sp.]|uniref:mannose-6-phosphate isomerase, class I n=1 Tax=Nocardioides sp. TaxID=35761 RepID=UPI002B277351|nr:mannose-6-phosphate isomerase, class I [Nocardioides sp.]
MGNAVRDYAWGSTEQLPQFLGHAPTGRPQAELWIGAHDGNPSSLPDGQLLNEVIAGEPEVHLGRRTAERFEGRLPFLMKVLAVGEPLSLQVHPSSERARLGFRREDESGLPLDAGHRNYKDRWHKPELIFALTRFEGLAGFRDVDRTVEILGLLHLPWAEQLAARLQDGAADERLREVVTETLALQGRPLSRLLGQVGDAARHAGARARRDLLRHYTKRSDAHNRVGAEAVRVFTRLGDLARRHPKDPGVLVTLLLNNVTLAPGEAMFVNAGIVHAYVEGFGVEIMASSDSVLRAGLTPKHMDVAELLAVTDFRPSAPPRWAPAERAADFVHLEPPVAEFCLTVGRPPLRRLPATGPRAVLVLDGEVEVVSRSERIEVRRGQSVFISHSDGPVNVVGEGRVAVGSVPL